MNFKALLAAGLLAASAGAAQADVTILAQDNGWYDSLGAHSPANLNIVTGHCCLGREFNSWFAFDLSGAGAASAIAITFVRNGSFRTDTGSESIALYDFTGSVADLVGGTGGVAAFTDLGSGVVLGGHTITAAHFSIMPQFTVVLPDAFVAQFNTARGLTDPRIALGARMTTFIPGGTDEAFWFNSNAESAAYLTVTPIQVQRPIPEPALWALLILGFASVGGLLRARRSGAVNGEAAALPAMP